MENRVLIRRLEQVNALNAVALAHALQHRDPSWGTRTQPVAGGHLVLCGPGLYVNQAIATGLDVPLQAEDIALITERSAAVGVTAQIEVTPATNPQSRDALTAHGFDLDPDPGTSVHAFRLDELPPHPKRSDVQIVSVSDRSLEEWQDVSAAGWGHATPAGRRAADAICRAAQVVDGDGMVIALDARDGRPLACASLTICEDVATLGGMSTLPVERGRGIQTELIHHRLHAAREAGCTLAMATTTVGGASERNLQRFGFRTTHIKQTYRRTLSN